MKFLVVIVVVGLVLWFMLGRKQPGVKPPKPRPPIAPQAMVRCAHCGMHLPGNEAVLSNDLPYCTPAHRDLGPRGT